MNNHDQNSDLTSPRALLFGAHRPSSNPRLHTLAKPYARPASYNGPLPGPSTFGHGQNGNGSPPKSPTRQLPSTRAAIPKSFSSSNLNLGQMTRSGSEPSLFSGIRSMLSRPLAWLATPSRSQLGSERAQGKKRDGAWDEEEPGTPTNEDRGLKRVRRRSPTPPHMGEYAPGQHQITGRAVTAIMLPPLPPDVQLRPRSKQSASAIPPNFSRPLKSSQSMPYLDPPTAMLSPVKKRTVLTRSKRVDLAAEDEEDRMEQDEQEREKWSPWKGTHPGRTRASLTPARYTPIRNLESREVGFPGSSPFRVPQSPSAPRQASGLARSATTSRLRRDSTAASDVSMGRESERGGSRVMDMNGHEDVKSLSGAQRESSALDWYMKDKWSGGGSPSARAASVRLATVGPSSSMPSIRKGQFVWDSAKGFVRENDLKAEAPQPVHQNDAERILFALESMRKTPLADARTSSSSSIPPDLIGSSSRSIRQAINVPLATAQAGDSARQRREKERLGDDYNVMISPYGRRKAVERDQRDQRIERSRSDVDAEYRPTHSHSPSRSIGSLSEASSRASQDMRSEVSVTPSPAPTPRRSARNKKKEDTAEEATPRAPKGRSKKAAPEPSTTGETPRRRTTRRGTADKANSPPPPAKDQAPPPPVPTITETAPSPSQSKASSSTYQIRDDSGPREKSSLRAKSDITKRTHVSAAGSRAVSPSSGRYSAREEDLPPMEELESTMIQLPSFSGFSGISFEGLTPAVTAPTPSTPVQPASPSSQATPVSLAVPSGRPGPLSRLNSSRPRASSPLASGSIVAEPESPPESGIAPPPPPPTSKPDNSGFFSLGAAPSSTPTNPPPLFSNIANDMRADAPKKSASFGLGKPSAPPSANGSGSSSGAGVPDFFGKKTAPAANLAPPPSSGFSFGLTPPAPVGKEGAGLVAPPAPTSFSFSTKPAEKGDTAASSSMFGGASALAPPAPPPASTFSFAQPSAKPAEAAAPKTSQFSFMAPAKAAEATPPTAPASAPSSAPFTFGASPSVTPADTPSISSSAAGGFNFGLTAPKPAEPAAASSMFGGTTPTSDASKSPPPPSNPFGGFFGKPAESAPAPKAAPPAAATPSANPFAFGSAQSPTTFSFGAEAKANGTGSQASTGGFGKAAPAPATSSPFSFGAPPSAAAPASAPAASTTFGFGAPSAPAPSTSGFGAAAPAAPPTSGFGGGFGGSFGTPAAAAPPPSGPSTPSTFSFSAPAPQSGFGNGTPNSNGFGGPSAAATPSTPGGFGSNTGFNFGQASTTPAGTPSQFQFGASNPSAPPTPAGPTPAFGFGGGSAPAASSPAQNFQFGAGAASSASPAPGGGGFQFGAPNAGQQQRFGSPQPGQQAQAPDAGGFSMGFAGDAGPPGSPGRRQIKPLRAFRKK